VEQVLHLARGGDQRCGADTEGDGVTDEDALRRLCDIRRAVYRERDQRLTDAWKAPLKQESSLAILIREPSFPIERVADVLRAECALRGRGKPGGTLWRWRKPLYLVAWFIEQSGAKPTDECISSWINAANGWAIMNGRRRLDASAGSRAHERVKTLLRESKSRRL
jgi:hypothetical protein